MRARMPVVWLDRIDNSEGYIPGNVQPCCARHNAIKSDVFTHTQMIDLTQRYHILCGAKAKKNAGRIPQIPQIPIVG